MARPTWLGLGVYLLVLAVSPVLHHDLECHLKAPSHCDACSANPLALRTEAALPLDFGRLRDAGGVETARETSPEVALAIDTPGRSPPA